MLFGVCGGVEMAQVACGAGYDYVESSVAAMLKPQESDDVFQAGLEAFRVAPLPFPVLNVFVPGEIKITGPDADLGVLEEYVTVVFSRARMAGVEAIVFGSGGARKIPEGFDGSRARDQVLGFCRMFAPIAHANGVTVVVEPLNTGDCNILTSVGESAALVREVAHPALRLLVDTYHWGKDRDSVDDIVANGSLFGHTHTATVAHRLPPGAEPCEFVEPFFRALKRGGYDGRVSIEGRIQGNEAALAPALEYMKRLCAD